MLITERLKRLGHLKAFYDKYERLLIPGLLVAGFIGDLIAFRSLQIQTTLKILGVHAVLAGLALVYIYVYDGLKTPPKFFIFRYLRVLSPLALQFSFGALLSSSLLFYWFSGSFSVSWPLIALVAGVMISSELFRQVYLRPAAQFSVYTFVLLSYFALLLPFVLETLSSWVFILSGTASALLVLVLILLLTSVSKTIEAQRMQLLVAVLGVFVSMSALYFLNVIPPLPLSIREAGVYHDIVRTSNAGDYTLVGESESFWESLTPGQVIHAPPGDSIFVYTSIFAPTDLSATIYHRWQYYDATEKKWANSSLLHFTISGGRNEGYRGYSYKSNLSPGKWRVTVENERGQVLGRVPFTLVTTTP